jgi:tetratricopeptide (TPR) repeat protein
LIWQFSFARFSGSLTLAADMRLDHPQKSQTLLACALLAAVTLALYWPVTRCEFIHFDDPRYVTANPTVRQGLHWQGVAWAFRSDAESNWHPLTWLSHMLDVQLFGFRAPAHHLVNVGFHVANTLLLFLVLLRLTGAFWRCAFVAGLFALHPLHVESVAWIAERKDVLSTFFGLLALWAYVRYAIKSEAQSPRSKVQGHADTQHATRNTQRPSRFTFHLSRLYLLSLLLFALSLMSKPTLVTLPFLFLLLDYWPLARLQLNTQHSTLKTLLPLFREKLPFLALAAASCAVTLVVQTRGGAVRPFDYVPLGARLANAALGYASYLQKAFWPADLAIVYPLPHQRPEWQVAGAALLLAALTLGVVLARRRRYWLVGWCWFLGMLVPMIGLVQVGDQAIADRYTYLPLVGLFLALTWGLCELWPRRGLWRGFVLGLGMLAVLGCCAALTSRQLALWQNTETLMRHALAVTQNNYTAYNNLGSYYWEKGRTEEAVKNYRKSLAILPRLEALNNLGLALASQGKYTNAIACYETGVQTCPDEVGVRLNLADALAATGRFGEAIAQYHAALRLKPKEPAIHHELALLLAHHGRRGEALEHYYTALRLDPDFPGARNNLAMALTEAGRLDDAIAQYQLVLRTHPDDLQTHNNLGIALTTQGKLDDAIAHFHQVLRLDTNYANACANLGNALARQNKIPEALEQFRRFVRLKPDDPRGHQGLGRGLLEQGKLDDAVTEFNTVLRLQPDNPETRYYLGLALERQGKHPDALTQFKEALRLQPDYPDAAKALAPPSPRR